MPLATAPVATAPVATAPVATAPVAMAPAPEPKAPRRNGLTWVLGVLAVLLLAGTAVGGVLVVNTRQQTEQRLADQRSRIAELDKKLHDQESDIREQERLISKAQGDLVAARAELEKKSPCTAAVQALWDAAKRSDLAGVAALTPPMVTACGGHF
jgi:uncharacterized protein HemX